MTVTCGDEVRRLELSVSLELSFPPYIYLRVRSTPNDKTTLALPRVSGVFFHVRSVFHELLARESSRFHVGGVYYQQRSSKAQVRGERHVFRHTDRLLVAMTLNQI